ncbi:major facilitator superfamily domain-containing protein [Aspergillus pseudonomiae]|uniref:Major facilitator superfamily domain-containing protein n=1 Tax=Aspergillus pseudonomiae TaxID=1506151 RepID=A0A5N7DRF4_9EURO|nr:major facilitator superfamily domain-containing protein [Aspergillus pseudonomiae]KAE8408613.1 major facilitator superfamily domain-containing protein [Aspergillus pseudonomiae]
MSSQQSVPSYTSSADEIPSIWRLIPATVALCPTLFCISLYGTSYLFTTCAVQLIFGKLSQFYPSEWVFLIGPLTFELGFLICGTAPTSDALIVGRSIAGVGAAGLFSGCIIILSTAVPLRVRPLHMGLGSFTGHLTWRWCFYINLPFGSLAVLFILIFLPSSTTSVQRLGWREQFKQGDLPGTMGLVPSIICLIFALQWGGTLRPRSNARIIALFVVSGVTFIIFLGIQVWQGDRATIPLRLMKNVDNWGAVWYGICIGAAMSIVTYCLPIWFQAIKDKSATQSGIDTLPSLVGLAAFARIGGGLASAIGYYTPLLIMSSVLTAMGAGLMSTLKVDSSIGYWFGYQVLISAGVGIGAQNVMLVASVAVEPADMPMSTTILTFTQTLSSAIFLPVGQSVGATGFRDQLTPTQLPLALLAYNEAIVGTFYVAGCYRQFVSLWPFPHALVAVEVGGEK